MSGREDIERASLILVGVFVDLGALATARSSAASGRRGCEPGVPAAPACTDVEFERIKRLACSVMEARRVVADLNPMHPQCKDLTHRIYQAQCLLHDLVHGADPAPAPTTTTTT